MLQAKGDKAKEDEEDVTAYERLWCSRRIKRSLKRVKNRQSRRKRRRPGDFEDIFRALSLMSSDRCES